MTTSAAARWRRLVRARLQEMEALQPGGGSVGAAFWDRRARRFASQVLASSRPDPTARRIARDVRSGTTVLDVGSGPGRLALPLAERAASVVAVDPSRRMLEILRHEARRRGIANLRAVRGRWEEVEVDPADVVVCAYVLPLVEDAAGFLSRLHAHVRARAFVVLGGASGDLLVDGFWRHFHGRPRRPGPSYLDAVAVLRELGIEPLVEILESPTLTRYGSLSEAIRSYRDQLLLPDTREVRRELSSLLHRWLVPAGDASLRPPFRTLPVAVLTWGRAEADGPGRSPRPRTRRARPPAAARA